MLKYIYTVTEDLFILVTLITLICAFCGMVWGRRGRTFLWAGVGAGLAASAAMAIVKNTTRLIYTNQWNLWVFVTTIAVTVLCVVLVLLFGRGRHERPGVGGAITCVTVAALAALLIFYELPDVMAYPFLFNTSGNGIVSVDYLVRLIGWILALILMFVYARYLYRCTVALRHLSLLKAVLCLGMLTNAVRCFGQALRPWLTRAKWLPDFLPTYSKADYTWVFPFSSFIANNEVLLNIIVAGLALLIPIVLFLRNLRIREAYANPAQHRKLKSACRRNRRQAVTVVVCFALAIVNLTVVKAYDSRVIELSPPESYTMDAENVYIPLAQIEDGHLHRFEYISENGIDIRWIVIRKPGSAAYGVGLDACEVCGDAGYFERSGQVICKRCDVVMNINTIGFKGGCNPIPLAYRIGDGRMFFRMIKGALFRQRGKMLLIAFTIALGASLATAMLNTMLDVGDKVNQELKTYGANIVIKPKASSLLADIYNVEGEEDIQLSKAYLLEDELGKLKTEGADAALAVIAQDQLIGATPYRYVRLDMVKRQQSFMAAGTDFEQVQKTSPYFSVDGRYPENEREVLVGKETADIIGVKLSSIMELTYKPTSTAALGDAQADALMPDATLGGSAEGWGGGMVYVTVQLDDEARIASVEVDMDGCVDVSKKSRKKLTEIRRDKIGLIFQQFHMVNYLTAVENVMVSQYYHSMPDEEEALAALDRVGLRDRARHLPSQLSGGEQQRVCVARALINHPELILADEPTGNLDETNENIVLNLFSQLHREGTTLIVVTHDPEVAAAAQRTIVLEHGRVAQEIINTAFGE